MDEIDRRAEVLIVGGGPVGMGLAIELGQRGISVIVAERRHVPERIPKGQNLTQRSGEHLAAWGVFDEILAAAPIPPSFGSAGVTAYGTLLSDYTYDWYRRASVAEFYSAENARVPQYITEAVLRRRVAALDTVTTLYGWRGARFEADEDGVDVVLLEAESGARLTCRADYVVGCDGSRSVTREAAGLMLNAEPHDRRMVLLVFRSTALHELLERFPGKSFFNVLKPELDGDWAFLGRVDLGTEWFFHMPASEETTDFAALVQGAVGADFPLEITYQGFWDLRIAYAESFGAGRIFIAGDAAHSHPPYGGFGINTGFEDVRNLGWKLDAALRGWAGEALLASYSLERQPVFASTAQDFIDRMIATDRTFVRTHNPVRDRAAFDAAWSARAAEAASDVLSYRPHYAGSPIVFGPEGAASGAVGTHRFIAEAGQHLPPADLADGRALKDVLSQGFTLISFDGDTGAFETAAARLGVPLTVVRDPAGGAAHQRFAADQILLRPDGFVAWTGTGHTGAAEVLARATGHLG